MPKHALEPFQVTDETIPLVERIAAKAPLLRQSSDIGPNIRAISRIGLSTLFDEDENAVIDSLYHIDTLPFGVHLPTLSSDTTTDKLTISPDQTFIRRGREFRTGGRHITPLALSAFTKMSLSAEHALHRPLILQSGYRSPAYQSLLFTEVLVAHNFDMESTVRRASVPGHSEHADVEDLATDIIPAVVDTPTFTFEETAEYEWLQENAEKFDFYLSYPKDNAAGLIFEPWHWRHRPSS